VDEYAFGVSVSAPELSEQVSLAPSISKGQPSWWVALDDEELQLRVRLAATGPVNESEAPYEEAIRTELNRARTLLDEFATNRPSVARRHSQRENWRDSSAFELVRASLDRAGQFLLLIESADAVQAQVPGLRAAVKAYLDPTDARFDVAIRLLDSIEHRPPVRDIELRQSVADVSNPRRPIRGARSEPTD
jgi:hypothetical protein